MAMRLAVMQPYIFPYIGYFQLLAAADKFVVYDDVNFIQRGWINRNQVLLNNRAHLFSIPLSNPSQNRLIYQVDVVNDDHWRNKLMKKLSSCYRKAPFFSDVMDLVVPVLQLKNTSIAEMARLSIESVVEYLAIEISIVQSSRCYQNSSLVGAERIMDVCRQENCADYINPLGGRSLYQRAAFEKRSLSLAFLQGKTLPYQQFNSDFVANLSIIDVMMFNDPKLISNNLLGYELVDDVA